MVVIIVGNGDYLELYKKGSEEELPTPNGGIGLYGTKKYVLERLSYYREEMENMPSKSTISKALKQIREEDGEQVAIDHNEITVF